MFAERRDAHAGPEKREKKELSWRPAVVGEGGRRAEGQGGGGGGRLPAHHEFGVIPWRMASSGIACVLGTVTVLTRTKQLGKGF